jgi:voltage-gated potassium channel
MATIQKLLVLILLLFAVIIIGAVGYSIIEGWSLANSLYMTVITVATVGFREVGALSAAGRVYTIGVIVVGVGIAGFTLSSFTAFLVSGQIRDILRAGKMQKKISRLKNHFIVCGAGRMGYEAIRELRSEKRDIVVIESDEDIMQRLESKEIPVVNGDATDDNTLREAGVERAKGLLAALPEDADNVYVSLSARGISPNLFIIARGTDALSERKLLKAGADRVILPYQIGGRRMASVLVRPEIVDFLDVMMGKDDLSLRMEIVSVEEDSSICGKTLSESEIRAKTGGALIMGLIHQDGRIVHNPRGDQVVKGGDQLIVLGQLGQIQQVEKMAR